MSALRSRDQRLAKAALEAVQRRTAGGQALSVQQQKEYRTRAKSTPAMMLQSGLAQTVGFLRSKEGAKDGNGKKKTNAYGAYLEDLAALLDRKDSESFHRDIIAAALPDYQRITREVLAAAGWLKRMAEIEINSGDEGDQTQAGAGSSAA